MAYPNNRNNSYGNNSNNSRFPMQMGANNNQFNQRNNQQRRTEKRKNPLGSSTLKTIDYLDGKFLLRFTNSQGKILPKRINKTTAYQQRQVAKAIKYARHLALIPFVAQDLS